MRTRLLPALISMGAAVVLACGGLAVTPTQAASPGFGDLTVTLVDTTGAPVPAMIYAIRVGSGQTFEGAEESGTTVTFSNLPSDRYGIYALSPWGGLVCAGVAPCNQFIGSDGVTVVGAVDVPDNGETSYQLSTPLPATVVGTGRLGSVLAVDYSAPMDALLSIYGVGVYGSVDVQWLRDGVAIPGGTSTSYIVALADVGHTLVPRLSWSGYLAYQFGLIGLPPGERLLAGRKVAKVATKTKVSVFRKVVTDGRGNSMRVDVSSPSAVVLGKVKIELGKWKTTKKIANGVVRASLPAVKPGKYTVKVTYLGTDAFAPSKGKTSYKVT